jgi:cell division transport system ATP-binding protein
LADEPTGNLDPELSWEVMQTFQQFSQVGVTVLIATHDLEMIKHMGHRILALKKGQLVTDTAQH